MSSATNFFERQDDARRNTSWLVALFAVAVVLVILALSVPLFLNGRMQEGLVVGGVVGAVVLLASGFRLLQLRGGAASELGGTPSLDHVADPFSRTQETGGAGDPLGPSFRPVGDPSPRVHS